MEYNATFFILAGIISGILTIGSIMYWTLFIRKHWLEWVSTSTKIWQVTLAVVTLVALLYSTIRLFLIGARATTPNLILFDFIILIILTVLTTVIAFDREKQKIKEEQKYVKIYFLLACLIAEVLSLIFWLLHFAFTPELFMFVFYGCVLAAVVYLIATRNLLKPKSKKKE